MLSGSSSRVLGLGCTRIPGHHRRPNRAHLSRTSACSFHSLPLHFPGSPVRATPHSTGERTRESFFSNPMTIIAIQAPNLPANGASNDANVSLRSMLLYRSDPKSATPSEFAVRLQCPFIFLNDASYDPKTHVAKLNDWTSRQS